MLRAVLVLNYGSVENYKEAKIESARLDPAIITLDGNWRQGRGTERTYESKEIRLDLESAATSKLIDLFPDYYLCEAQVEDVGYTTAFLSGDEVVPVLKLLGEAYLEGWSSLDANIEATT